MNKVNVTKFEAWEERNLPRIRKVHPYIPKRVAATIEKVGLPFLTHLQSFNSMYIHGDSGTGKTVMAVQYMLGYIAFRQACQAPITATFISVPELMMQFRESYSKPSGESEREILERYCSVGLLVLDDLGVQNVTEWSYQMLYMIINRRYDDMAPVIITSNSSLEDLETSLKDQRIPSRLDEMCDIIENKKQYRHV